SAAQLAPITPVPTIAMRRMGLLYDISVFLCVDFYVSNSGEIALRGEQHLLVGPVEFGAINGAAQIADKHSAPFESRAIPIPSIKCVNKISGGGRLPDSESIAARLTVFPRGGSPRSVQYQPLLQIEFEIDRLGQTIEQELDVAAVRCVLTVRNV